MNVSSYTGVERRVRAATWTSTALMWASIGLIGSSWLSSAIFGLYILAFYIGAIPGGLMDRWNGNLPGLFQKGHLVGLVAMSAHLVTGAVILLLGPVQLIDNVRSRWPGFHRWCGRIYVFTAGLAGIGGLGFILSKGTIGGAVMNAGFGLYGLLMILAAEETYRRARQRRFELHRRWAIRLFALALGSWLYRMDYGFWMIVENGRWHTTDFRGVFDMVMCFFFYLPNLIAAELFIRSRPGKTKNAALQLSASAALGLAMLIVLIGTYYFTRYYWGPGIIDGLTGRPQATQVQ